jgi:hypothetical protein
LQHQIGEIMKRLERDRKFLMNELKKNFNFIEGANLKGEEAWKFERNLYKKILRPAKAVTSC